MRTTTPTDVGGAGIGLRIPHIQHVLQEKPKVPWFEVHTCNFLSAPLNQQLLHQVRKDYPLSFHGVSLNLGGTDPLNHAYLQKLKNAIEQFEPRLVSEHACFTTHNGQHFHDLLPVPYTPAAIDHFANRIEQVQEYLGREILIENISKYYHYPESSLSEAEFLAALCQRTGCRIILDINNIYVNQTNFVDDASLQLPHYLATIPAEFIGEVHLAGHSESSGQLIDTHSCEVSNAVWNLFETFLHHWQLTTQENQKKNSSYPPCLIEWDTQLPEFTTLEKQRRIAEQYMNALPCSTTSTEAAL